MRIPGDTSRSREEPESEYGVICTGLDFLPEQFFPLVSRLSSGPFTTTPAPACYNTTSVAIQLHVSELTTRPKRKHIVLPTWVFESVEEETLMNEDRE